MPTERKQSDIVEPENIKLSTNKADKEELACLLDANLKEHTIVSNMSLPELAQFESIFESLFGPVLDLAFKKLKSSDLTDNVFTIEAKEFFNQDENGYTDDARLVHFFPQFAEFLWKRIRENQQKEVATGGISTYKRIHNLLKNLFETKRENSFYIAYQNFSGEITKAVVCEKSVMYPDYWEKSR